MSKGINAQQHEAKHFIVNQLEHTQHEQQSTQMPLGQQCVHDPLQQVGRRTWNSVSPFGLTISKLGTHHQHVSVTYPKSLPDASKTFIFWKQQQHFQGAEGQRHGRSNLPINRPDDELPSWTSMFMQRLPPQHARMQHAVSSLTVNNSFDVADE